MCLVGWLLWVEDFLDCVHFGIVLSRFFWLALFFWCFNSVILYVVEMDCTDGREGPAWLYIYHHVTSRETTPRVATIFRHSTSKFQSLFELSCNPA